MYRSCSKDLKLNLSIETEYDNYHKISACYHVCIPKFWYTWHKWTNTETAFSDVTGFT